MSGLVKQFLDWLRSLFWKEEMELTLVGLQNSGKTTLVNVLAVSFPSFPSVFAFYQAPYQTSSAFTRNLKGCAQENERDDDGMGGNGDSHVLTSVSFFSLRLRMAVSQRT